MKSILFIYFQFLLIWQISSKPCNQDLLISYDIHSSRSTTPEKNYFCPLIKDNCCGYEAQISIYRKWVISNERKKITRNYMAFYRVYQSILKNFKKIEEMAEKIIKEQKGMSKNACGQISSAIIEISITNNESSILQNLQNAFEFLYTSRRGLYCTLCDSHSQQFFDEKTGNIWMSNGFCSKLISKSLNFLLFKEVDFMKISRLYSQLLISCDLLGTFHKDRYIESRFQFFKNEEQIEMLQQCRDHTKTPMSYLKCKPVCEKFHPTKYNKLFEGSLPQLYSFERFLQKKIQTNIEQFEILNKKADLKLKKSARLLADKDDKKKDDSKKVDDKKKKKDEGYKEDPKDNEKKKENGKENGKEKENEKKKKLKYDVDKFNEEQKSTIVLPVTYDFMNDLSYMHNINFKNSVFMTGMEKKFDLCRFNVRIDKIGLDLNHAGKNSQINKKNVIEIIKLMQPNISEEQAEKKIKEE